MAENYRVRVGHDNFIFSCGHFISFAGHQCEKLHGHNYRATVEVDGPLGEDWYVFDFVALKRLTLAITGELDHHMLVATRNPVIHVATTDDSVEVSYKERRWVFPRGDCVLLAIENTTAELLAKYLAGRLLGAITGEFGLTPDRLSVEVEENVGQSAVYEWMSPAKSQSESET